MTVFRDCKLNKGEKGKRGEEAKRATLLYLRSLDLDEREKREAARQLSRHYPARMLRRKGKREKRGKEVMATSTAFLSRMWYRRGGGISV